MAAATLDEANAGCAIPGLGSGFSGLEAMGVHRNRTVRALRQAVLTVLRLWSGETVTSRMMPSSSGTGASISRPTPLPSQTTESVLKDFFRTVLPHL